MEESTCRDEMVKKPVGLLVVIVPTEEIISVKKIPGRKGDGVQVIGFAICYVKHQTKYILKQEIVQFLGSAEEGEEWSSRLQETLDNGEYAYTCIVRTLDKYLFSQNILFLVFIRSASIGHF